MSLVLNNRAQFCLLRLIPPITNLEFLWHLPYNTELKSLRKIIRLRKSKVSVEKISVCNAV